MCLAWNFRIALSVGAGSVGAVSHHNRHIDQCPPRVSTHITIFSTLSAIITNNVLTAIALRELTCWTFVVTMITLYLFVFVRRLCDSAAQAQEHAKHLRHCYHYAASVEM
jgi:hypothetical protein